MVMLAKYLEATSIHGLKYLYHAKNILAKAVWLLLIAASFSCAVSIILMTLKKWDEQPTTVKETKPVLLEDAEISPPMLLMCPRHLNFHSLLINYYNKFPPAKDSSVTKEIKKAAIRSVFTKRYEESHKDVNQNFYTSLSGELRADCLGENNTEFWEAPTVRLDHDCSLFNLMYHNCTDHAALLDYLVEVHLTKDRLTHSMLEDHCSRHAGGRRGLNRALNAYMLFFDITAEDTGENLALRPVEDYVVPTWMGADHPIEDMGYLIGNMFNFFTFYYLSDIYNVIADHFKEEVVETLDIGDHIENFDDLADFFAYFLPGNGVETHFLKRKATYYGTPMDDIANCSGKDCAGDSVTAACQRYCDLVAKGVAKGDYVAQILDLAVEEVNTLKPRAGFSLLPDCNWRAGGNDSNCWKRIVNERGVCFTATEGEGRASSPLMMGSDLAREFFVDDVSSYIGLTDSHYMRKWETYSSSPFSWGATHYDLMVMPHGQSSLGRLDTLGYTRVELDEESLAEVGFYDVTMAFGNVVKTTGDFAAIDPAKRGCLYHGDRALRTVPTYSEATCVLECTWRLAAEECGCVPWHLLGLHPGSPICEHFGHKCFAQMVEERHRAKRCSGECPADCEIAEMRVSRAYEDQNTHLTVSKESAYTSIEKYIQAKDGNAFADPLTRTLCKDFANFTGYDGVLTLDLYHVAVYVDDDSRLVTRITMTATVSAVDIISSIGGTLGLFSGFSILSGAELLYWTSRFVADKLRRRKVAKIIKTV